MKIQITNTIFKYSEWNCLFNISLFLNQTPIISLHIRIKPLTFLWTSIRMVLSSTFHVIIFTSIYWNCIQQKFHFIFLSANEIPIRNFRLFFWNSIYYSIYQHFQFKVLIEIFSIWMKKKKIEFRISIDSIWKFKIYQSIFFLLMPDFITFSYCCCCCCYKSFSFADDRLFSLWIDR